MRVLEIFDLGGFTLPGYFIRKVTYKTCRCVRIFSGISKENFSTSYDVTRLLGVVVMLVSFVT